jgi:hypothetical protein
MVDQCCQPDEGDITTLSGGLLSVGADAQGENPQDIAAMKPKRFIGCNMRPRQVGYIFQFQETAMTQSQRLKYSILISLVVLGIMFGLSWLQNTGAISEKMFQYIAIGVAVIVVVINGVMRRKVKP